MLKWFGPRVTELDSASVIRIMQRTKPRRLARRIARRRRRAESLVGLVVFGLAVVVMVSWEACR